MSITFITPTLILTALVAGIGTSSTGIGVKSESTEVRVPTSAAQIIDLKPLVKPIVRITERGGFVLR